MPASFHTLPDEIGLSESPAWVAVESGQMSGSPGGYTPDQDNLSCILQIRPQGPAAPLAILEAPYSNIDRLAWFNISGLFDLEPFIPPGEHLNNNGAYRWSKCAGAFQKFKLAAADSYGDPPAAENPFTEDLLNGLMIYGGRRRAASLFQVTGPKPLHAFRDHREVEFPKPTTKGQPEFMYFYTDTNTYFFSVQIDFYYTDGTIDADVVPPRLAFAVDEARVVYELAVGWDQLDLSSLQDPSKVVYRYKVHLAFDEGGPIEKAGTMDFLLDADYHDQETFIFIPNGLGGMESVRCKGGLRQEVKGDRDLASFTEWHDFTPQRGNKKIVSSAFWDELELSTGYYSREYIYHIRNLLRGDIWLIDKQNGRFLKYIVLTDELPYYDSQGGLYQLTFRMRPAWDENFLNDGNQSL